MSIFLKILVLFFSISTFAQTKNSQPFDLANEYQKKTKTVLNGLQKIGIKEIACRGLSKKECYTPKELSKKLLEEISFIGTHDFAKPEGSTRWTAHYSSKDKAIYINQNVDHPREMMGYLGLHELLGALGSEEPSFAVSVAAFTLLNSQKKLERQVDLQQTTFLKETLAHGSVPAFMTSIAKLNSQLSTGGATVIGGGGDSRTLKQRILLTDYLLETLLDFPLQEQRALFILSLNLPIEVIDSDSNSIIYPGDPNLMEPAYILIPNQLTEEMASEGSKAANRAVEEVGDYFLSRIFLKEDKGDL